MKAQQQVSQHSTPTLPRVVSTTPVFDQKYWMGVPGGGQVKVGLRENRDGSVEVAIQTRYSTYGVPNAVATPASIDSTNAKGKIQQWVVSSLWEGNIPNASLYPLNGSSNEINPHPSRRCITTFPLVKHGLRVMQDYDNSKKVFFLYLEEFKDQQFFTSRRPIIFSDFANPDGPVRQAINKLSKPAIVFDLKSTSLHPRAVLSWAANNELTEELPQLHGKYWNKEGNRYLGEGGKIGLINTQDGGRFFASLIVEASGGGPHSHVPGTLWAEQNKKTINAHLANAGASPEFMRGFKKKLDELSILGAAGVGLDLLTTGAKVGAVRPPSLHPSSFSSRPYRRPNRPATPGNSEDSGNSNNSASAPSRNVIVPFNRIQNYTSVP